MKPSIDTEALNGIIVENIEEILDYFAVDYVMSPEKITAMCPIHGSDNEDSLTIYLNNDGYPGIWKCWTNGCEAEKITTIDAQGQPKNNYRVKESHKEIEGAFNNAR